MLKIDLLLKIKGFCGLKKKVFKRALNLIIVRRFNEASVLAVGSFQFALMRQFSMSPPHEIKRCRGSRYCEENAGGAAHPPSDAVGRADRSARSKYHPVSPETGDILFGSVIPRVISRVFAFYHCKLIYCPG